MNANNQTSLTQSFKLTRNMLRGVDKPENAIICLGKLPSDLSMFDDVPCNVYRGWHIDSRDCVSDNNFVAPIFLSDNTNTKQVQELATRYNTNPMTYVEFNEELISMSEESSAN